MPACGISTRASSHLGLDDLRDESNVISSILKVFSGIAAVLAAHSAFAQNTPVYQSGLINRGHGSYWITNGVVGDAGPASAGNLTELGITNTGTPFCVNDALATGPYHQLCIGALALGGGLLNYGANNGAGQLPFTVSASGPLVLSSQINNIQAKNLPTNIAGSGQLCISPTTGVLSIATGGVICGGGLPPAQALLLNGGGNILLNGGGRILLN
jgi:hypothetical protein